MVRGCVAVWIVAWGCAAVGGRAGMTKCCPGGQALNYDLSCEDYASGDQPGGDLHKYSSPDGGNASESITTTTTTSITTTRVTVLPRADVGGLPWWVSDKIMFLRASNLSESFKPEAQWFDEMGRMPCDVDNQEPISISNMAVLDDGQLIVFINTTGNTTEHTTGNTTSTRPWLKFASTEYCIDRMQTTMEKNDIDTIDSTNLKIRHMVLVCQLCSQIICVPKCCSSKRALEYNTNNRIVCEKAQSAEDARAAIRLEVFNGTKLNIGDYYLNKRRYPDCGGRGMYMKYESDENFRYSLMSDGRMHVDDGVPIESDEFCVESLRVPQPPPPTPTPSLPDVVVTQPAAPPEGPPPPQYVHVLLACRLEPGDAPLNFRDVLYGVYFVVGAAFLAATLLIYVVLPELRVTVHSGNLIAHTACLFVSYATLGATRLVPHAFNRSYACVVAAFVIQFTFLAAFFWLNVMCADIAWTFSGFRLLSYTNTIEHDKKKYIIYSIYAWGCSIVITVLTALAEYTKIFSDDKYKPNFGYNADCWFSSKFSVGVFFYLPIGVLLLTNFILFLFTAFRIVSTHADTSRVLNRQTNQNNMRLSLYLKLFCLMGVTFVFEVLSWAVDSPPQYWYVTDAVNSLRGVFVFFIFCWKRSVLKLLLDRTPKTARDQFIRTFRLRDLNSCPSLSSVHPKHPAGSVGASVRTRSASASGPSSGNSSFQLSNFGSSTSVLHSAGKKRSSSRY